MGREKKQKSYLRKWNGKIEIFISLKKCRNISKKRIKNISEIFFKRKKKFLVTSSFMENFSEFL